MWQLDSSKSGLSFVIQSGPTNFGVAAIDAQRFNSLLRPNLEALYRAAFRLVRNKPDAEDLVQEVCVRAIQRLADLDESRPVRSWFLAVLHNLYVDGVRRATAAPFTRAADVDGADSACPDPGPEEQASIQQREERLQAQWSRLGPADQMLLALRAEEYSAAEIAEITNIPISALYARLYRARANLARLLYGSAASASASEQRMEIAK